VTLEYWQDKDMRSQWTLDDTGTHLPELPTVTDRAIDSASGANGTSPPSAHISPSDVAWLPQAIRQLNAIEGLPDGWDSHGGARPDQNIVRSAHALIVGLANADRSLLKPHVNPTPSGGVQFHWESGSRYFEIELIDPQTAVFYFADPDQRKEVEGELHVGDPLEAVLEYARTAGCV
jgi:hypothetical protein